MACTSPLNETQRAAIDQLDAIDERLYHLQHIAAFIADIALGGQADHQIDELKAESVAVTFGWIAKEAEQIRNIDISTVRKAVVA